MSCNHKWSEECYAVVPSQVCERCNAFRVEEEEATLIRDAFRRGAEAMREACAELIDEKEANWPGGSKSAGAYMYQQLAKGVRALPIPEEP